MAVQKISEGPRTASEILDQLSTGDVQVLLMALTNGSGSLTATDATLFEDDLIRGDDAVWILTSTFIIFTMQSGFGLLESGSVSAKNEVNIMVKNAGDVIFGGLTYWLFGYAFSFGDAAGDNPFCGVGYFAVQAKQSNMGLLYSKYFFQSSFATTATTIVSGAMAERTKLDSYLVFSLLNTIIYVFPAHWVWAESGWLYNLGAVDIAGCGPVHVIGGVTGLVATVMLKPRHGRFDEARKEQVTAMGSPTNVLFGMFMLWWGWLGFNCGSTFGISGAKFKLAARSAVVTVNGSVGGGATGIILSYFVKRGKFDIPYVVNGVLGGLVGITGICALAHPWEGLIIGCIGALIAIGMAALLEKVGVDDPVGAVAVHGAAGLWGVLSIGFFGRKDVLTGASRYDGLFYGGGFYLLGVQLLLAVSHVVWAVLISFALLTLVDRTIGLRLSLEHELLGCDFVEHNIGAENMTEEETLTVSNMTAERLQELVDRSHFNESAYRSRRRKMSYGQSADPTDHLGRLSPVGQSPPGENPEGGRLFTHTGKHPSNGAVVQAVINHGIHVSPRGGIGRLNPQLVLDGDMPEVGEEHCGGDGLTHRRQGDLRQSPDL